MKTKAHSLSFAALLALVAIDAQAERITVDIGAIAASFDQYTAENRISVTNGWTTFDIDSYSDAISLRINRNEIDEYIDSPVFQYRILRIETKLKSSSQQSRRLAFIPIYDGVPTDDESLWSLCDYSPNKDTFVPRTNHFARTANVHAFRMALDRTGGSTGWGVSEMTIVTDDTVSANPPTDLVATSTNATSIRIEWNNDANTISNRISAITTTSVPESGTVLNEYDFSALQNTGGNNEDITETISTLHESYAGLSGILLYIPANSSNELQISTRIKRGVLTLPKLDSYAETTLSLTMRRHPTDTFATTLPISYEINGVTNAFAVVSNLTDTITRTFLNACAVPDNARLILNDGVPYGDTTAGKRRFLFSDIKFIRGFEPAHVITNIAHSSFVVGDQTSKITGLHPATRYFISVTSFGEDEIESAPSEPIEVWTSDKNLPFTISVK